MFSVCGNRIDGGGHSINLLMKAQEIGFRPLCFWVAANGEKPCDTCAPIGGLSAAAKPRTHYTLLIENQRQVACPLGFDDSFLALGPMSFHPLRLRLAVRCTHATVQPGAPARALAAGTERGSGRAVNPSREPPFGSPVGSAEKAFRGGLYVAG